MSRLMRYTILGMIAGVILAFNMYHADYKLLVAQVGTIVLVAMFVIARLTKSAEAISGRDCFASLAMTMRSLAMTVRKPGFLFLAICVLSFILSPHNLASWQELYKVGTWIVFGMIVGTTAFSQTRIGINPNAGLGKVVNVWLVCAGIVALYGILQFFGMDFMKFKLPGGRIVSTFGNATLLAGFLAMTIPIALARTLERKKAFSFQLSAVSLILILIACLILTKSRGGILAAMVGCGILILAQRGTVRGVRKLLLAMLIGGVVLLMIPQSRHIIFEVLLRRTARIDLWKDSIQLIRIHPIFGTGIGTFGLYFPQVVSKGVLELHPIEWEFVNHAHSEYLEILAEMGMVGLVAFLAVVAIVLSRRGLDRGLVAALVAILVHNLVSVDLRYTSTGIFFWMIVGLLCAPRVIAKAKPEAIRLEGSFRAKRGISEIASSSAFGGLLAMTKVLVVIIGALCAIYFTVKPCVDIHKFQEQEFFAKDRTELEGKIVEMEEGEKDTDYYFNLGVLYAKNKDFQKAKEYFIKAIRENPQHAGAFNNLGNIAFLEGDAGRARAFFHKAVNIEPDNVDYLVNFSYACFKVNVMGEATESLEKALSIEPDNSRARLLRRQMTQ